MLSRTARFAILGLSIALVAPGLTRADEAPQARVLQYQNGSGETVQALMLKAPAGSTKVARDQVVLFDTSASQTGSHRDQALATLDQFAARLPEGTRVRLFAVDVVCKEMTNGFVATGTPEWTTARELLLRRAPLGASNMHRSLSTALQAVETDRPAGVVFIGDGISSMHLLRSDEMQTLADEFRTRQIPVSSYAVGPRTDLQLLGVLAHWTGGSVIVDNAELVPAVAGMQLADAATAAVTWLDAISAGKTNLVPAVALPLRSDRETIWLSRGAVPANLVATVDGRELRYSTAAATPSEDNAFLSALIQRTELHAINTPLAGETLLSMARSDFNLRVNQLSALGDAALLDRDLQQAAEIGKAIRELDPANENADRFVGAAARFQTVAQLDPADDATADPADPAVADPNAPTADPFTQGQSQSLINEMEAIKDIITQRLSLNVSRSIQDARRIAEDDPDTALNILKRALGAVRTAGDIDPDTRVNLARRLQGVIADVKGAREVREQQQVRAQERLAAREAQRKLIDDLARDDDRMERLIDRVRSLIYEADHGNPSAYEEAESVAEEAVNMRPGDGVATAAQVGAEAAGQLYIAYYMRTLRADRFLATLEQVERSHVAFPDEPPIRWPAPEVWKALSERRKQYASVDLHKASPAEKRILSALDDQTSLNFADLPLVDAVQFVSRTHEIPIIIDEVALEELGILTDEPINLILAGVTLRSGLKLMLEPLELTYIVEDEVMKITTQEVADLKLSTRVYPVGDLVVPLNAQALGGGIGGAFGGGQGGGLGGGQGGGGFGGGGGGFGGGGGGFGGGGGGVFSIPPQKLPKAMTDPAAKPADNAQKPADPELQNILDGILKESASTVVAPFTGFAQVTDQPFKFDNRAVRELKKKP